MNRGTRIKLKQLKVIVIGWMIMGFLITVHDYLLLNTSDSLGVSTTYSFALSAARSVGSGLIAGIIGGSILVFYVNVRFQDKPYGYTLLIVSVTFVMIVFLLSMLIGVIMVPMQTGKPMSDPVSKNAFMSFMKDSSHLKALLAWSFVVLGTQLLLQVNSKFGQAEFWNIISGKYNRPKKEKRIFMFVDINSSTSIAEKLGDEKYHMLLKDYFADLTGPILENKGSIYQYVGDEVVIAWNYEDGRENIQCIKCFFDMKLQIKKNEQRYLKQYGVVPGFKAGIHCGKVIAGEIGIIKRDITYSGDVLNTTSRILNKCNEYEVEIIASNEVLSQLFSLNDYVSRPLGAIKLRGKNREVQLNALIPI